MKLFAFVICLFFFACQQQDPCSWASSEIALDLAQVDSLRFSHPERLEALLSSSYDSLIQIDNELLWAKYFFLLAHLEMVKGNYNEVFCLLDSIGACEGFVQANEAGLHLLKALVYEKQLLYEPSYESFKRVVDLGASSALRPDERLIALLGKARIEFWLMSDYKTTFKRVQAFLERHKDLDRSYYHANAAILDSVQRRQWHLRMSEQCALQCMCHYQLLQNYIQHAAFCQEQDSIDFYLAQAMACKEAYKLDAMYVNTYLEASYLEMKSKSLQLHGHSADALALAQQGIGLALRLRLEDKAYRMSLMSSEIQFAMEQYTAAMQSKDDASKYRLAYSQRINADKMKYLTAKEQADKLMQENRSLWAEKRSKTFQIRLILTYSIIVTLIIYFLYANRRKIKMMLNVTRRKSSEKDSMIGEYKARHHEILLKTSAEIHKREMLLKDKQVRLAEITTLVKESPYKDKSKLSKIESLVALDQGLDSWDLFYEAYVYKYPKGEKQIRACFPSLSTKDYHYLMCVHYGLTHDKMARLFSIQKASVRKRCLRLKQALSVPSDTEIKTFLMGYLSD